MMVSLSVSLLWLLAMLAAAVHIQDAGRTPSNALRTALSFVVVLVAASWFAPQPNWVGVLIALGAFWRLIAGPLPRMGGFLGGASVGLAAALQIAGGVNPWLAALVSAVGLACGFLWGGEPGSGRPREGLLVAVAIATPPVGLMNDILFGWHSARVLGGDQAAIAAPAPPAWALGLVGLALAAGLLKGFWIKR